eukprot:ANDGO_07266.mRNA.1 hypothetical protein
MSQGFEIVGSHNGALITIQEAHVVSVGRTVITSPEIMQWVQKTMEEKAKVATESAGEFDEPRSEPDSVIKFPATQTVEQRIRALKNAILASRFNNFTATQELEDILGPDTTLSNLLDRCVRFFEHGQYIRILPIALFALAVKRSKDDEESGDRQTLSALSEVPVGKKADRGSMKALRDRMIKEIQDFAGPAKVEFMNAIPSCHRMNQYLWLGKLYAEYELFRRLTQFPAGRMVDYMAVEVLSEIHQWLYTEAPPDDADVTSAPAPDPDQSVPETETEDEASEEMPNDSDEQLNAESSNRSRPKLTLGRHHGLKKKKIQKRRMLAEKHRTYVQNASRLSRNNEASNSNAYHDRNAIADG